MLSIVYNVFMSTKMFYFYIVRCADGSLYSGITTNVERRVEEHNSNSPKSAKYTRYRGPVKLVYFEKFSDRSVAMKREWQVKQMTKYEKELLVKEI